MVEIIAWIFGYGSLCYPSGINGRGLEHINGTLLLIYSKKDLQILNESEFEGKINELQNVTLNIQNPTKQPILSYIVKKMPSTKEIERVIRYPNYEKNVLSRIELWGNKFIQNFINTTTSLEKSIKKV